MMRANGVTRITKDLAARIFASRYGLLESARRTYVALVGRHVVRRNLHAGSRWTAIDKAIAPSYAHASALSQITVQIITIAQAGATRADLQRVAIHVQSVIDRVRPESRPIDALDIEEIDIDAREERAQGLRWVRGETHEGLIAEAEMRRQRAAVDLEMADELQRRAFSGTPLRRRLQLA